MTANASPKPSRRSGSLDPEFRPWNTQNDDLLWLPTKKQYASRRYRQHPYPVAVPGASPALITVERAGIMKTDIVTITGSYTYKLPIEAVHAPNVYVAVALVRAVATKT